MTNLAWTILRPIVSSFGMTVVTPLVTKWAIRPVLDYLTLRYPYARRKGSLLLIMILFLSAMLAISNYTESSVLYGAYIAGCALTYLDEHLQHLDPEVNFSTTFEELLKPVCDWILVPLFFAIIGTAVPFVDLFRPAILWKGILYATFMWIGKAGTGLCIIAWPTEDTVHGESQKQAERTDSIEPSDILEEPKGEALQPHARLSLRQRLLQLPIFPALLITFAMVSRGEISLLIAQLGRSTMGEDFFLVVMWAIVTCTFSGALMAGIVAHKYTERCSSGVWG